MCAASVLSRIKATTSTGLEVHCDWGHPGVHQAHEADSKEAGIIRNGQQHAHEFSCSACFIKRAFAGMKSPKTFWCSDFATERREWNCFSAATLMSLHQKVLSGQTLAVPMRMPVHVRQCSGVRQAKTPSCLVPSAEAIKHSIKVGFLAE